MLFEGKLLEDVDENDLHELVGVERETKTTEYKSQAVGSSDNDKREFKYDITSLANTGGGHIFLGVTENAGIATGIPGLSLADADAEILRLESILLRSVSPRINGIASWPVTLGNGNHVIIMRVPQGWNAPHLVEHNDSFRCYARTSAGKYIMDTQEIRAAILLSESIETRIGQFRVERAEALQARNPPERLMPGAAALLHFVPLSAFRTGVEIDFAEVAHRLRRFEPIHHQQTAMSFNLDGLINFHPPQIDTPSYVQVYRNGIIEAADALALNYAPGQDFIPQPGMEQAIVYTSHRVLNGLNEIGIAPPIFIFLTLLDVEGFRLGNNQMLVESTLVQHTVDRPHLFFPEVVVREYDALTENDIAGIVKPLCDAIWNSVGHRGSPHFHTDGTWQPITNEETETTLR